jgi:hypothetical protein
METLHKYLHAFLIATYSVKGETYIPLLIKHYAMKAYQGVDV